MSWVSDLFDTEEDRAHRFFDFAQSIFDLLDYDTAADNLRRYRSGVGGIRTYTADEMSEHPAFGDAIDRNRTNFESLTFTGKTGNRELNQQILGLRDGESTTFKDRWDDKFGLSQPSTYLAFGRSGIHSEGNFEASRSGDHLVIRGRVTNRLGNEEKDTEAFDFNPFQIGYREGNLLERLDEASPFEMDYRRRQDVEADLRSDWGELE
ncbi:MAG TPA: hypothetical protein VD978_02365 [Azospirillum sp.]|nr:hypothetical protein [Azospirillum sp.]